MNSKSYTIQSVGEVVVVKNPRSRRISLKLRAGQSPKVVIPSLMPFDMGYRFALEKTNWILEHRKILEQRVLTDIFNEEHPFSFRNIKVEFVKHNGAYVQSRKTSDGYTFFFPESTDFSQAETQQFIRKIIAELLRGEAKKHLPARAKKLADDFGFVYNKLSVKDVRSRWGSCSAANNINLNIHLMRLPEYLSDFVILHELCHTVHKNHGPQFHALLDKLVGGREKMLDKELNSYKTRI